MVRLGCPASVKCQKPRHAYKNLDLLSNAKNAIRVPESQSTHDDGAPVVTDRDLATTELFFVISTACTVHTTLEIPTASRRAAKSSASLFRV